MSPENKKRIQECVSRVGKDLEDKLKPIPEIPNRNPYAHLWKKIKIVYGRSYTECSDDQVDEILNLLEQSKNDI